MPNHLQNSTDLNISISGIFSNSHFKRVIEGSEHSLLDAKIEKYQDLFDLREHHSYGEALSVFYDYLLSDYRCEYVYKNLITRKILLGRHSLNTSTLINEFRIASSLADVVLINGKSTVYEIKTELDSPDRLSDQLADYQKAFSNIYLVVHHSQEEKYRDLLRDSSVGLLALNNRFQLSEVKKAEVDTSHLDITTMFKSLRKEEYTNVVSKAFGFVPDVPNMFYFKKCLELARKMDPAEFHHLMSIELKKRKPRHKDVFSSGKVPDYLSNICLAIDPTEKGYHRLFRYLNNVGLR